MRVRNAGKSTVHVRRRRIEPGETAELSEEELRMSGVQALLKDGTLVEVEDAAEETAEEKPAGEATEETAERRAEKKEERSARRRRRSRKKEEE